MALLMYSIFFHALVEQIILSHKLPMSAHCSVTAAEEQSRGAVWGWGVQAHSGELSSKFEPLNFTPRLE